MEHDAPGDNRAEAFNRLDVSVTPSPGGSSLRIDPACLHELDVFFRAVNPAVSATVTRPITVWRDDEPHVVEMTATFTGASWQIEFGAERRTLTEAHARFDPQLDELSVMAWVTDRDRLAIAFNTAWLEYVNAALEDELGWGWMQHAHPDDLEGLLEAYEQAVSERRGFEHTARVLARDGLYHDVRVRAMLRLRNGEPDGFVGLCLPLTSVAGADHDDLGVASALPATELSSAALGDAIDRLARLERALEVSRPARTREAALLRRVASRWLLQHEALHTRHDDIVLVVGEATSNATLHAYAEDPPGPVQLSCLLVDDHAEFRVRDWGSWRTMPAQHDGRGLQLMASLADAFEVRRHDDGTEVVLTFGM